MLSLGKIAAGAGAARYYTNQVADGREDYYAGEGEAPGQWIGAGAEAAGLRGQVEAGQFEHLLAGGGLRKAVREGAVAGFDMTFRAPKSVSVLWGIADPATTRQLGEAHDAAVEAALGYLEREACWARRGAGGVIQVRGAGFVAAAFRHRASRAGDPLLHTHVVAGNLTLGPDGRWTALDARHLYRHAKTAGFLYQAELRRELTQRLGLGWQAVEHGTADVEGVPREVVEHFSRRRAEILEHMAAHGGRSATSAQVAALETRRAKQDVNADRLRQEWRARAAEHGLTVPGIEQLLASADLAMPLPATVDSLALTEHASVFGRPELLQALAEAQPRGASIQELERLADATLAAREVVALPTGPVPAGLTERRFTTADLLATEHDLLDRATRTLGNGAGLVDRKVSLGVLAGRTLSAEQRHVVVSLCGGGDGVSVVRAAAGTGKTFVLDAAREAWEAGGREILGCALSARAALELSDQAAIASVTIAQLTARLADGMELPRRGVLVVDEAGMVGTRDLALLAAAAERVEAKLVLVGDDRQLPEIQAGGAFHALAEKLPTCQLQEVRRQHQAWDRRALDALRSGEVEQWARAYRDHGQITVADNAPLTRAALVNDWSRATGDRLMIAARRDDVRDLNQKARELLQAQGTLGPDELSAAGRGFATGDRVIGARNDRRAGILNGQRATVLAIDRGQRQLEVALDDGRRVRLGAEYLSAGHLEHGYAITAHRAQGATVDRTFVLGSEELYREWGYTALSRHRDQARFYIARGDLRPNTELPPPHDPLITGIAELLKRSNAKELAIDSLPQAQRQELENERQSLREQLRHVPPPRGEPAVTRKGLTNETPGLRHVREQEHELRARLDALRWRDRAQRPELERQLKDNLAEQQYRAVRLRRGVDALENAHASDTSWLATHGTHAERFLTVAHELRSRDAASDRALQRLDAIDRDAFSTAPPERHLELDHHTLDLDL